ncbi:hypothetical protein TWF281_001130 [Arthrobotrys megalospora]
MFAISFDTSSSTYRPSYSHSPASSPSLQLQQPRSFSLYPSRTRTVSSAMDTSVQPFNTGGVHAPGAPPTEYASISLDTEMLDEDEVMAMGDTSGPADFTLETPVDAQPAPDNVISNKVHLRGLDSMSSDDVKAWIAGHFPEPTIEKLEWIDDTSLNLVYKDEETALAALSALSTDIGRGSRPWELREAKSSAAFPLARLDVRLAFVTDRKEKGARERSRYYLFHPEEDRVEQQEKRKREQEKERRERREYRRRDYDDRKYRSGSGGEDREWDERRRSRSRYDDEDSRRREPLELFPNGGTVERRGGRRSRSRSPVELFPEKTKNTSIELFPEATRNEGMELFPEKVKNASVELFPGKNENPGRRREGSPSGYRPDTPPRTLFSIDDPVEMPKRGQSPQRQRRERERPRDTGRTIELFPDKTDKHRSLADRIDNPRAATRHSKHGDVDMGDVGLSIRGSGGGGGINIRGAAKGQAGHSNAGIELLPDKASNSLFNRISEPAGSRRGARRQKAEDMFG